jgi:chromosome segregation and condensation protein ScpB
MRPPAQGDLLFDRNLADLPPDLRWREWMGRVEAAIFASREPVPRENLSLLVGDDCRLDELIADIQHELADRPYELAFVAGGWRHRTRLRFADAIRAAGAAGGSGGALPLLSQTDNLVVTAIAYLQPVTRGELSRLIGKEVSRDIFARLKRLGLIGAGPRSPAPGAPLTYVTTKLFLEVFGLGSLRDLPDVEALEDAGLLERGPEPEPKPGIDDEFDRVLGLVPDDEQEEEEAAPQARFGE